MTMLDVDPRECPSCAKKTEVLRVWVNGGCVHRRRVCTQCGTRITTIEAVKDEKKMRLATGSVIAAA